MSIIAFITELFVLYIIVRVIWSFLRLKKGVDPRKNNRENNASPPRFDTRGENVSDADFEEIKEKKKS
jgi:hypothetical protein